MLEKNNGFKTIQVKSSTETADKDRNSTIFSITHYERITKGNTFTQKRVKYSEDEVDYFSLYSVQDDDIYLVKNKNLGRSVTIRNYISENINGNNFSHIRMAKDYQIDKVLYDIDKKYMID